MIKRICIDNYKSLVDFELRLQELTLLVGRNGAGKTAVLDVLYALRRLLDGGSRVNDLDVFPTSSLTRWQERDVQTFRADLELGGTDFTYQLEVEHDRRDRRARIILETLSGNGGPLFSFAGGAVRLHHDDHSEGPTFKSDWRESALARVVPGYDNILLTSFLEFIRGVRVCGLNHQGFVSGTSAESHVLARDGRNFVEWYRHLMLERPNLIQPFRRELQEVLDEPWELLSDGQRARVVLYALTTLAADSAHSLFVDNPVNHVELPEIQPWLVALADACGSEIPQAVLCFHNPEVIDYLGVDRCVLLLRDNGGPTRAEPLADGPEGLLRNGPLRLSEALARGWER